MYEVVLSVHVLTAIVGFGSTFTYPLIELVGRRAGGQSIPVSLSTILFISRRLAVPAAAVVGITGIYQLVDGPFSLSNAWLAVSLILYVTIMVAASSVLAPAYERARVSALKMLSSGQHPGQSPDYLAATRLTAWAGPALAAGIIAVAVLMVSKPE